MTIKWIAYAKGWFIWFKTHLSNKFWNCAHLLIFSFVISFLFHRLAIKTNIQTVPSLIKWLRAFLEVAHMPIANCKVFFSIRRNKKSVLYMNKSCCVFKNILEYKGLNLSMRVRGVLLEVTNSLHHTIKSLSLKFVYEASSILGHD